MPTPPEDREAIRELRAEHGVRPDEGRFEEFARLFAGTAAWGPERLPKPRGPAAITDRVRSIQPVTGAGPARPNIVIRPEGDAAPLVAIAATDEDHLVRMPAARCFQARRILNDVAGEPGLKR